MSIDIKLDGTYYIRTTSGIISRQKRYSSKIKATEIDWEEEGSISQLFFYGKLPEDFTGKRFTLVEAVNTEAGEKDRRIPDNQSLKIKEKEFVFSKK